MTWGRQLLRGLVRWGLTGFAAGWLASAIGIGCLYGNCAAGLLVLLSQDMAQTVFPFALMGAGLFATLWLLIWAGLGWTFKWMPLVAVIAGISPWAATYSYQTWTRWKIEGRERAGPVPPMAGRTPVVIYDDSYRGERTFGCTYAMSLFHKTQGPGGILAVPLSSVKGVKFSGPIALADLPLELHRLEVAPDRLKPKTALAGGASLVAIDGDGNEHTTQALKDISDMSDFETKDFTVRVLSKEERQAAASEIDYLVLSPCRSQSVLDSGLRQNPAFAGLRHDVRLMVAMAPLEKGKGSIDLPTLSFDLLDLDWRYMAKGLVPFYSRPIHVRDTSPGLGAMVESFCAGPDGGRNVAC